MTHPRHPQIQLSEKLRKKVDRLAKANNRPFDDFVNTAVAEYVETAEKAARFRRHHFQEAQDGPLASPEEVDALFAQLLHKNGGSMDPASNQGS